MNKVSKKLRVEEKKLEKLRAQTKELLLKSEDAESDLADAKIEFGKRAIAGDDVSKLSAELSLKQNAADIFEQDLRELSSQIAVQETSVVEAEKIYYQQEATNLVDQIVSDSVKMIEAFLRYKLSFMPISSAQIDCRFFANSIALKAISPT